MSGQELESKNSGVLFEAPFINLCSITFSKNSLCLYSMMLKLLLALNMRMSFWPRFRFYLDMLLCRTHVVVLNEEGLNYVTFLHIFKKDNNILESFIMSYQGHLKFTGYVKKQESILSSSTNRVHNFEHISVLYFFICVCVC